MSRLHDQGEKNIGDIYLRNASQNTNLFLGLYTNSTQPGEAATMAAISEVSGGGYARVVLSPAHWTEQPAQTAEGGTRYDQPQKTFTFTAAVGGAAGYFIVTAAPEKLVATEHFAAVIHVNQASFEIRITPRIEIR